MEVVQHSAARTEFDAMPAREASAMQNAIDKLEAASDRLSFPHTSAVQGADRLRTSASSGPKRMAGYRRIGDVMVIGSIGLEAESDPRGFQAAIGAAVKRLATVEQERS